MEEIRKSGTGFDGSAPGGTRTRRGGPRPKVSLPAQPTAIHPATKSLTERAAGRGWCPGSGRVRLPGDGRIGNREDPEGVAEGVLYPSRLPVQQIPMYLVPEDQRQDLRQREDRDPEGGHPDPRDRSPVGAEGWPGWHRATRYQEVDRLKPLHELPQVAGAPRLAHEAGTEALGGVARDGRRTQELSRMLGGSLPSLSQPPAHE
jgi:hypothetical protein